MRQDLVEIPGHHFERDLLPLALAVAGKINGDHAIKFRKILELLAPDAPVNAPTVDKQEIVADTVGFKMPVDAARGRQIRHNSFPMSVIFSTRNSKSFWACLAVTAIRNRDVFVGTVGGRIALIRIPSSSNRREKRTVTA